MSTTFILYYLFTVVTIILFLLIALIIADREYIPESIIEVCEDELDDDYETDEEYFYYQTYCYNVYYKQGRRTFTKTFETEDDVIEFINDYKESGKGTVTYIEKVMISQGE
jgi:hypothetical protein